VNLVKKGGSRLWRRLRAWLRRHRARLARMRRREPATLRLISPFALMVVVATIVGIGLGFMLARQSDDDLTAKHRQALLGAIEALQAVAPDLSHFEPKLIRILEHASGLKGLRFDADPADGDRAVHSVVDGNGRIIGWLSWERERPATGMMARLLPLAGLVTLGVIGFAGLVIWQLRRMGSQLVMTERQVHKLEYQDPLTGLPNQQQVLDVLDRAIAARPDERMVALAVVDLEGFNDMKDAVGDAGGDEAIIEIANRLRRAVSSDVLIGRLNSRKFALVMSSADPTLALATAEAARDIVSRAIWVNQVVQVSASVSFALSPRDGMTGRELMRRSRLALRVARRRGRGVVVPFAREMEVDFAERQFIKLELSRALAARELDLHYQPIVNAEGGGIVGVEALLRWNHASRGFVSPAVFVRVAEEVGLMDQLGEFVLRRALADAARWPSVYISVNLSPMQVRNRKFVDLLSAVLKETKFEPARLVLEVTEGVLIDDPETAKSRLEDLRKLGVRLALDDFGSGYSSLTYLQQLPFDKLKIDRGFVAALDQSANAGVIIQAIVALGRALGMGIVIEGVETEHQRVLLRLAGCNEMQGYLFARPGPREAIDRLLAEAACATPAEQQGARGAR
jgi:diguanylate cyclase (GGDEF)-like protein